MLQRGSAADFGCEPIAGVDDTLRLDGIHCIVVPGQVPEANGTQEKDGGRESEEEKAQPGGQNLHFRL
jgi:hypothetical protein